MNDITTAVNHASKQDYQWMFTAMFVILLIFITFIWRWMTSDREKLATRLTEMTDRHITASEKMVAVVTNNTQALQEVREVISHCRKTSQQ